MSRKIKVDLTGVESFQRANEGKHDCRIASAELKTSQSGNEMITIAYEVAKGEDKGARVYENYPLVETALWKLKGMLQAIGMKADGKVQLDLDKLIGKMLCVNVIHEEYEGQLRARVESVMKISAKSSEDDEFEDEDEEEDEPEEKPTKKATSKKAPMNPPADEDEEDEDDDWDDDEEDEEEAPAPKKKAAKPAAKKTAPKKAAKKSEEDEDDWDEDEDDDWDEE